MFPEKEERMLIHEDSELETAAMCGDFDVIVPVSIYLPCGEGEPEITAYRNVWDICRKYETENFSDILDGPALGGLLCELAPVVREMGYDIDLKGSKIILEYRAERVTSAIEKYAGGADIVETGMELEGLECPLIHRPEPDGLDETDVCAVVVKSGEICACAGVNDLSDDDLYEIFVETAVPYRGHGYGTAAVAALARRLIDIGCTVGYRCAETNRASLRIAEKLGMTYTGKRFSVICYAGELKVNPPVDDGLL